MTPIQSLKKWWKRLNVCTSCCHRPPEVFGVCRKCFLASIRKAQEGINERERRKFKEVVSEVFLEIESEKQ